MGADGGLRRVRQPARADDGRDLGGRDPGALGSASRSSSATSAGSRSCRTTSRSRCRSARARSRRSRPRSNAPPRAPRWVRLRCASPRPSTTSAAWRMPMLPPWPNRSSRPALHESRLLQPDAAVPLGDRRLLRIAPAGPVRAAGRRRRPARPVPPRPARGRRALPRRQRRRGARLDRRGPAPATRRGRPPRLRPAPPRRRADLRARGHGRLPLGDGARGRARRPAARVRACSTTRSRRSGRRGPRTFRWPARCCSSRPA